MSNFESGNDPFGTPFVMYRTRYDDNTDLGLFISEAEKRPNEHFIVVPDDFNVNEVKSRISRSATSNVKVVNRIYFEQDRYFAENYKPTKEELIALDAIAKCLGTHLNNLTRGDNDMLYGAVKILLREIERKKDNVT